MITNPGGFLWDRAFLAMTYVVDFGHFTILISRKSPALYECVRFPFQNCRRNGSFLFTFLSNMSLRTWEKRMVPEFLRENQPLQHGWVETVKAVYQIHSRKLFKREYKSVENYLEQRWNDCCRKDTFYRLSNAGKVISRLEDAGCEEGDLPSNTRLCLAVMGASVDYSLPLETVWIILLGQYGHRDNVSCSDVRAYFKGQAAEEEEQPQDQPLRIQTANLVAHQIPQQEPTPDTLTYPATRKPTVKVGKKQRCDVGKFYSSEPD